MPPKRFGMTLKRLRKKKGWTQPQLAERVGIHRVYLAHLEDGRRTPSLATLGKLARVLRVKVAELLD